LGLFSLLSDPFLGQPLWAWLLFFAVVAVLLALDLGLLHRKDREIPAGESLALSAGYIAVALVFAAWVWWSMGAQSGIDFLTGYLVEKSLSLDNIFVISLIFTTLAIPRAYQHRVLFYGILGVVVLRAVLIGLGASLVASAGWLLFVFAAFLIFTGGRILLTVDKPHDISKSRLLAFFRRHLRLTSDLRGHAFLVREAETGTGRSTWRATPLFLALVMIEAVDLVFAVDSVPAILAITTDPYIVYTSNIFAVLGLRALYFAFAASVHRFHYLKYALGLILILVGAKIFVNHIYGKIDPLITLGTTAALIAGGILASLWLTRGEGPKTAVAGSGSGRLSAE
jgi:tellurite resistance protein TerC